MGTGIWSKKVEKVGAISNPLSNRTKRRSFEEIISQLETLILSRRVNPGERLPSERKLQAKYNVGRGTVREGLRALEEKGLIEIKKGAKGGAYIKEADPYWVSRALATLIQQRQISLRHIAEFREAVESNAAAYAAERAKPKDIDGLKQLLGELRRLSRQGLKSIEYFYRYEKKMHADLARISGNLLFEWIISTLSTNLEAYDNLLPRGKNEVLEVLDDWRIIIEAIEGGEVMRTRTLMASHLHQFRKIMEEKTKLRGRDSFISDISVFHTPESKSV